MSLRPLLIVLALLLGVIGIVASWPRAVPPKEPKQVAFVTQDIPTYTQITQAMVEPRWLYEWTDSRGRVRYFWRTTTTEIREEKTLTDEVARGEAQEVSREQANNAILYSDVIDRMTTRNIGRGAIVTDLAALEVEQVRYVADLNKEIISFPARFDEIVGGQIKPGHRVNVYAYRPESTTGGEARRPAEVKLIASSIPVVDVRTRTGTESARLVPTVTPGAARSGGLFGGGDETERDRDPGSIVTVAVEPELAALVVDVLGAQGYEAWVTLAGNRAIQVTATPVPTGTPDAAATAAAAAQQTAQAASGTATAQAGAATAAAAAAGGTATARAAAATGTASAPTATPQPSATARVNVPPPFNPSATPGRPPTTGGQKPER